jgi:hypothetical protein
MALITQYDTITPDAIPSDAKAVAGYVGGSWPDYSIIVQRFPNALHKSVCINAGEDGDILDIENGDATAADGPGWYHRQKARGLDKPGLYTFESNMQNVINVMNAAGIPETDYVRWMAWLGAPTMVPGMHARQYTFNALGRNLDASICDPSFWGGASPPVKNNLHYERFPNRNFLVNGLKLDPESVVKRYDKNRARQTKKFHPARAVLAIDRKHLQWLAGREYTIAYKQPRPDGHPSWGVGFRGWLFQHYVHRAQGQRFV